MTSLHKSCFLNNVGICGSTSPFSYKLTKLPPASVKVTALGPNKDLISCVLIENNNNSGTKQNKKNKKKKRGGSKRKMTAEQTSSFKSVTEWVYLDHPSSSSSSSSSSWIVDDFGVQKSSGLGMEKMMFELHSYTKHSDGLLSPSKLVERAHGNGVSLYSFFAIGKLK